MKAALVAFSALVATALAAPANHAHGARQHKHKRDIVIVWETITVGQDGRPLATVLETTTQHQTVVPTIAQAISTSATPVLSVPVAAKAQEPVVVSSSSTPVQVPVISTTTPVVQKTTATAAKAASTTAAAANAGSSSSGTSGLALQAGSVSSPLNYLVAPSVAFVDGTIPCSSFPYAQQGVVALDYLGFGGYTGIQLNDGSPSSCQAGALCSYACQPGMLKTQWPTSQPSDGQSRGGLQCKSDGMLYLSDSSKPYLCEWGQGSAFVSSTLGQGVAICQTDYPGTENMVIPTWVAAGASGVPLSVVNEDTYYKWQGKLTSAQFYVNNAGVSQQDGCLWGTPGSNVGNYAPLNFGAGYTGGISWLSMIPNPGTTTTLNFNVKIVAGPGSTMNGGCQYVNGVFSGESANSNGCTVACTGACYYELY